MAQIGSKNHNSKLNESMVRAIRREYARTKDEPVTSKTRVTMKQLAQRYNVSETQIETIIHKRQWKHVNVEREDNDGAKHRNDSGLSDSIRTISVSTER